MTTLRRIVLTTGAAQDVARPALLASDRDAISAWFSRLMLRWDEVVPLPGSERAGYVARAYMSKGGLVMTVASSLEDVLVMFAVLGNEHATSSLWADMCVLADVPLETPATPWLAVRPTGALRADAFAASWMDNFERCVAWTWIDRISH